MAFVRISPRYGDLLDRLGLRAPDQFLALPAVIVSGHPNRHVAQVQLGTGEEAISAYLKREHRVPWRDRLASAWAGVGPVAKSQREAFLLEAAQRAHIGCPDWIAFGEDAAGRAFLLVRELADSVELRTFLQTLRHRRRQFARKLGETLARMHEAGLDHPDLYSKHVLVHSSDQAIGLLDWQRSQQHRQVALDRRWRDLAALDATVNEDLASPTERLLCLRAYLRAVYSIRLPRAFVAEVQRDIRRHAHRLLRHRRIQEMRQPPLPPGQQNLVWLEGEELCVTREFQESLHGQMPNWLRLASPTPEAGDRLMHLDLSLPGARHARLTYRSESKPFQWLLSWFRKRLRTSPELQQAGTIFRLQRHGIRTEQLLAVGERHAPPWRTESFLLTEPLKGALDLTTWLGCEQPAALRRNVIREAAGILKRLHAAGCYLPYFATDGAGPLLIKTTGHDVSVVVGRVEELRRHRHLQRRSAMADLAALRERIPIDFAGRTDGLRFLLAYLDTRRLTADVKKLIRAWILDLRS